MKDEASREPNLVLLIIRTVRDMGQQIFCLGYTDGEERGEVIIKSPAGRESDCAR